ncbi:hypothetical protein NIES37_60050 [Tolypothrix tenuis PCC 7101]|uniref:Uncharacterized protein n=1 Tax=Tolypothrix tenuis PCC 7101 TaxID=231146 RepID=A0A1Z4N8E3_9CYAN|nr:hypothetical protein NIES37_60050 [Tolypothrix tenuis PCC 7101]BAZ74078.1 hypothetical protein NIES50_26490 [Aulosira laxa NIES-50]
MCQLKLKAIYGNCCTNTSSPHPLTPSPAGEGELNLLLPSPGGRGAGGEGRTLSPSGFHVKLTPMTGAVPLQRIYLPHALCPMPHAHFQLIPKIGKYLESIEDDKHFSGFLPA